jgi:hypothetical protein
MRGAYGVLAPVVQRARGVYGAATVGTAVVDMAKETRDRIAAEQTQSSFWQSIKDSWEHSSTADKIAVVGIASGLGILITAIVARKA